MSDEASTSGAHLAGYALHSLSRSKWERTLGDKRALGNDPGVEQRLSHSLSKLWGFSRQSSHQMECKALST